MPSRNTIRSYLELKSLPTFKERFEYLKLGGNVGNETFGQYRYLNQMLYRSPEWKSFRRKVILRDEGCDLGVRGHEIIGEYIIVHHLNPITIEDLVEHAPMVMDMNNVISTKLSTHNAIHYGAELATILPETRSPNDTCPWKR